MTRPALSVIIPVYKVEPYLRACVDSVLAQTFEDLEVILVDDGSPDGCPAICDEYAEASAIIRVLHQENGGLSAARNAGLAHATGEYVAFLDSDDVLLDTGFFGALFAAVEASRPDVLLHQRRYFSDEIGEIVREPRGFPESLLEETDPGSVMLELSKNDLLEANSCVKLLRRDFLVENGLAFKDGILSEDVEWFFRLAPKVRRIAVSGAVGYGYRRRVGSITHSKTERHLNDMIAIVTTYADRYRDDLSVDPNVRAAVLNYLAYQYFITLGMAWRLASDRKGCLRSLGDYAWLTDYCVSRKTRAAALAVKLSGGGASLLLHLWMARLA